MRIETYFEPFVGGGAVFFALGAQGRFRRAVLGDTNRELVEAYRAIRSHVDGVIAALEEHAARHSETHYYEVRDRQPSEVVERAARLIYLNKTGFNGLYRVNSRGGFNVPFGRYKNPGICDATRLRAVSRVLRSRDVELRCGDFEDSVAGALPGDFVYLDPPYVPLSRSASFTSYGNRGFSDEEQVRLAELVRCLGLAGVAVLLSNSDCDLTRALYGGLEVDRVLAARAINSVADRRGPVAELLVEPATP